MSHTALQTYSVTLTDIQRDSVTHLEVVVLSLLLCLQIESSQASQVLLTHRLVHLHKTNLLTDKRITYN